MAKTKTITMHKHNIASVVANCKVGPTMKFANMRANTSQKFSIASANLSEKMTHPHANVLLKFYLLQHPSHPVKQVAAAESIKNMKAATTERRRQKVARATDMAASKLALVRERWSMSVVLWLWLVTYESKTLGI